MIHELKILPEFFLAIYRGQKNFELRRNDRGFQQGHVLKLKEFHEQDGYTGRVITAEVTFIVSKGFGLEPGFVCMSIRVMSTDFWPANS